MARVMTSSAELYSLLERSGAAVRCATRAAAAESRRSRRARECAEASSSETRISCNFSPGRMPVTTILIGRSSINTEAMSVTRAERNARDIGFAAAP